MSMRDFVVTFNKITSRIPIDDKPTTRNLKTFFISAMLIDINYDLRRSHPIDLADAQKKVIKFEDDLISAGKWKGELQTKGSSNHATSSDKLIQKLSNELVTWVK